MPHRSSSPLRACLLFLDLEYCFSTQPWQRESLAPHFHARSPPAASAASVSFHRTFPPPAPPRLPSPRKFRYSFRIRRQSQEFPGSKMIHKLHKNSYCIYCDKIQFDFISAEIPTLGGAPGR
ncbi:hypothetical protein ABFS83_05G070400 [Erythranthe nasuta]